MGKKQSDRYIRFYGPILDALRALGGSASPSEVKDRVIEACQLSDDELAQTLKDGSGRVANEIAWARDYLRRLGFIDGSERGVWRLTELGMQTVLSIPEARQLRSGLYSVVAERATRQASTGITDNHREDEREHLLDVKSPSLLEVVIGLSSSGFERLCQRLLREAGFTEVRVTGKTGDGGIDGDGILQVNELVSFRVLLQCKRYQGSVSSKEIRDFRGAMTGRTDKGIFLTTGSFSRSATEEATRDGAPPIELVDGEKLVLLMERLSLGVRPRTVFDVDDRFFEEYL